MSCTKKYNLLIAVMALVISISSCKDLTTNTELSGTTLFSISVKDSKGQAVQNLRINVWNYYPLFARQSNAFYKVQNAQATNRLNYQISEKSYVRLILFDLNGNLYKELVHDTLQAGYYSFLNNLENEHLNIRVHKCLMVAQGVNSGSTFRDSTYLVYWSPDSNTGYLGYTSDKGEFSTNDSIDFPHLYSLPNFIKTEENNPSQVGTFKLSDSIVITLTNPTTGEYMRLMKRMPTGNQSNHFDIVWAPSSSKNQAVENKSVATKILSENSVRNTWGGELASFTLSISERDIILNWSTATEVNLYKFNVQRSTDQINFATISQVRASGTSNSEKAYTYIDKSLDAGAYYYRLQLVDGDGAFTYSAVISANVVVPQTNKLSNCFPNPYN